jgi:hypothetical protein
MASFFPSSVDNFANPIYTKIDGIDVVQAAHVNDLQDAARAVQELLIAGRTISYTSNNYIANNASFKLCIENLDSAVGALEASFNQHKIAALVSDPAEHHGNVIVIDPIGNLSSSRVQPAIYELQGDIDNILGVGSLSPVASLDSRYVMQSGAQSMQGPLTISGDLTAQANTTFGTTTASVHAWSGTFDITGNINHIGDTNVTGDILLLTNKKIAEISNPASAYMMFGSDKIEMYSKKDFVIRLDSNDATDGINDVASFNIKDGLGANVMTASELGAMTSSFSITAPFIIGTTSTTLGDDTVISDSKIDAKSPSVHVQLDKLNTNASARFLVTHNNDTGSNLASANLLLNLDETSKLVTGIHVLKSGIQEIGYFGLKGYSPNAGGVFHGVGVNFKHELTNSPSSVTLTVSENVNAQNITVSSISKYGFFIECDSVAVGAFKIRGTYLTVGN